MRLRKEFWGISDYNCKKEYPKPTSHPYCRTAFTSVMHSGSASSFLPQRTPHNHLRAASNSGISLSNNSEWPLLKESSEQLQSKDEDESHVKLTRCSKVSYNISTCARAQVPTNPLGGIVPQNLTKCMGFIGFGLGFPGSQLGFRDRHHVKKT